MQLQNCLCVWNKITFKSILAELSLINILGWLSANYSQSRCPSVTAPSSGGAGDILAGLVWPHLQSPGCVSSYINSSRKLNRNLNEGMFCRGNQAETPHVTKLATPLCGDASVYITCPHETVTLSGQPNPPYNRLQIGVVVIMGKTHSSPLHAESGSHHNDNNREWAYAEENESYGFQIKVLGLMGLRARRVSP